MRKLVSRSASASLASFSTICRFHVQTSSLRIPACTASVAVSNPGFSFYRCHSLRSLSASSYKTQWPTKVLSSRIQPHRTNSEAKYRNFSSGNDSSNVNRGVEEKLPESWPSYAADWSKHELLMTTCFGFWDFRPDGANVIASFIDTAASVDRLRRRQMPTVLVVPSGMSNNIELKPLLDLMVKDGWRVVIPDVIGMKICSFKYA